MELRNNTVLITGGGSGIGKGLAEAFHRLGNRVIVAGRRPAPLEALADANPGMRHVVLDVRDGEAVRAAGRDLPGRFPDLNCVINNAGVQRAHEFAPGAALDEGALLDEVNTNLLGVIRCCAAFVPHLQTRARATLVNVSSGLAFVPLARFPVYCATKAAVHSFTLSLRRQLLGTSVRVVELIPPYVATNLDRDTRGSRPHAGPQPMPLDAFIEEAMKALGTDEEELAIGPAQGLRAAGTGEAARAVFDRMNGY
jgi:uncharacterized oxidoreductase